MGARNIFGAFVIALAMFSFWPFVVGRYQQVSSLRQALAERQALVDSRQSALENFTRERDRYESQLSGPDRAKFSAMVPQRRSTAELVSAMDAIASGTGMRMADINVSEERARKGDVTLSVTISVELEGRYEGFRAYMAQLERSVRLLDVESIDIATDDRTGGQTYSVTARAYFLQ